LLKQSQLVSAALEEAERIARADEAKEAEAARERQQDEAKRIGQALAALHTEIDTMMLQMSECFERRTKLLNELRRVTGLDTRKRCRGDGKLMIWSLPFL
jgi:hypothetical protein